MSKKTKAFTGSIILILLVGTAGSLACASKGFKDWDTTNWETNIKTVFNKVADATKEKVADLNVDLTNTKNTYVLPESMSFGYNKAISTTKNTSSLISSIIPTSLISTKSYAVGDANKTVNVVAYLTPTNADYSAVEWTVAWSNSNSTWATGKTVADYVSVAKGDALGAVVTCKQAFSEPVVLKVKVSKNEIAVANTCLVQYYKALTSLSASWTGDMVDSLIGSGDKFTYSCSNVYGDGTRLLDDYGAQSLTYGTNGSLNSVVKTINYDFKERNELAGFDYDVFYGQSTNLTLADSTLSILNGKGRNAVNTAIKAMPSNNVTFRIQKGSIFTTLSFGIVAENVIYPESVTIGDGSDITIQ